MIKVNSWERYLVCIYLYLIKIHKEIYINYKLYNKQINKRINQLKISLHYYTSFLKSYYSI